MADYDQIMKALRNADAAGDTEGARRLAAMARSAQTQTAASDVAPWDVRDARGVPGGARQFGPDMPQPEAKPESPPNSGVGTLAGMTSAGISGGFGLVPRILDLPANAWNGLSGAIGLPEDRRVPPVFTPAFEKAGLVIPEVEAEHPIAANTGAGVAGLGLGSLLGVASKTEPAIGNAVAPKPVLDTVGDASRAALSRPASTLAAETVASTGSHYGGQAGQAAGEKLGGDTGGAVGETIGSILGGITPAAVGAGVSNIPRNAMARSADDVGISSGEIFDALKRQGIEPSGGLVGNSGMARAENVAGSIPIIGGGVAGKQSRQVKQFGEAVQSTAARMRGYGSDQVPDSHTIGTKIQNAASEGLDTIKSNINALEGNLGSRAAKANSSVDVSSVKQEIAALSAKSTPSQQAVLNSAVRDLDAMRDVPIDAAKHEAMLQQRKVLTKNIRDVNKNLAADPQDAKLKAQAKTMRGNLEKLDGQIDANLGVDYTRLRAWRTEIGQATQQGGIPGGNMAQTYKATTGATQDFADRAGMRQDFDNLMSAEAELYQRRGNLDTGGDIPLTQKLANMQTGDDVYRAIVQGGQPEKLDAVRRNMHPDQWAEISADVIENMGRAKPGQGTAASDFSPETFLTNWNKLPARSKEIIAGDEMGALNDLAKSATAFRERGRAGNSSGTASHLMTGGTAAGLVTSPVATAATLTAGHLAGRGLASEAFAKMLAGKAPKLAERLLPRIVGQTGRSVQDIQEQQ